MDVRGARVLVTGASTGIGAALAVALGREGATVGLLARRGDLLDDVLEQAKVAGAGPDSRWWSVDLADVDAAVRVAGEAWDAFGGLDAFISNAAFTRRRSALRLQAAELDQHMLVNFTAPAHMVLALLPRMLERGSGTVVLVGSIAGRISAPSELSYVCSKWALAGFAETLAIDTVGTGITVRLVTPGPFDTPIWGVNDDEPTHYAGPKHPPSMAADAIVEAMRGDTRFETYVPASVGDTIGFHHADVDAWIEVASKMIAPAEEAPA